MGFSMLYLSILLLALAALSNGHRQTEQINANYTVSWEEVGQGLEFELEVRTLGYIGFGISRKSPGIMDGADIVICGVAEDGIPYLTDRHGVGYSVPALDVKSDYVLLGASENATHTIVKFSRLINTGDADHDVEIKHGAVDVIWAIGTTDGMGRHRSRDATTITFLHDEVTTTPASSVTIKAQACFVTAVLIALRLIASS